MPPSSRNQSSRREYADIEGSGYGTHDDYPNEYRHRPHAPHAGHRAYHPHVSSENREPRNNPINGSRITVTSYRIPTQGEFLASYHESTISYSYRDHRGFTVFDSHRSSSGYRERLHAPSCSCTDCISSSPYLSDLNDEDERYFSDRGKHYKSRSTDRWEEDAKGNRNDRHHRHRDQRPYQEKPKEPKATTDSFSSKSKSYSNHRYTTNNSPGQGKRESSSSQRPNKPHSSRSDNSRKENPGSNRSDPFHKDHGKKSRQEIPQTRAKEELPDHYGTLKIGPLATEEEIKSAAKRRRVEFHPDKMKKPGMSASELAKIDEAAAKVGQSADVLQNPKQKLEYDRKLKAANQ